jgi:hypothetical protein
MCADPECPQITLAEMLDDLELGEENDSTTGDVMADE